MVNHNIFIFGAPRSGTTWLAKILDSHPHTLLRHEPDTVNPTSEFPFIMPASDIDQYLQIARSYLHERTHDNQLRCVSSNPYFSKDYRSAIGDQFRRGLIECCRLMDIMSGGRLDRIIRVPDLVTGSKSPVSVVKSVDSCGRVPLFAKACPEDKFIFIVRHPCGVIASKFRGRSLGKMNPAYTFRSLLELDSARTLGISEAELESWSTLEADAWEWTLLHSFIVKMTQSLPNVYVLNYDLLCRSPVSQSKALFEWVGLEWAKTTGKYIERCISINPSARKGFYSTQQNPVNAANKWKSQLSEEQVTKIMDICQKSDVMHLFELADNR